MRGLKRRLGLGLIVLAGSGLSGCGAVAALTYVAVAGAALVGYGVYKTGEAGVDAVGQAGESTRAIASETGKSAQDTLDRSREATSKAASTVASAIFVGSDLKATYPATVDRVWNASNEAMQDMGFALQGGKFDALAGAVDAVTSDRKNVSVKLKAVDGGQTEARIRVGVRGDKSASELIHERISQRLLTLE